MKIAFISMIRDVWGGSEELWYATAKEALAEGHTVFHSSIYCGEIHPKLKELEKKGAKLYFRKGYIFPGTNSLLKFILQLKNFILKKISNPFNHISRNKPDVIIYTGTAYSITFEKYLHKKLDGNSNLFIIVQLNEEEGRKLSEEEVRLTRKFYALSKKVFFVSKKNLHVAEKQLGTPIPNGIVVRNPVNISEIGIIPFPDAERAHFAMVGNLVIAHKGQDIALRALSQSPWKERDFVLNIYGSGPDENFLKGLSGEISDKVKFHGKVTDIRQIWLENQLLLMPSRMEGMPLVMVEAMLCGRTTVASDAGGIPEWIDDGINGFLSKASDLLSFSSALEKAWTLKKSWQKMGEEAYKKAIKLYDPQPSKTLLEHL